MDSHNNRTPNHPDGQAELSAREVAGDAIRRFHECILELTRAKGGLDSARVSMGAAASSDQWGLDGGQFTADGKQVTWPLPSVLADLLVQVEEARSKLGETLDELRELGLDPARWARQANEYW